MASPSQDVILTPTRASPLVSAPSAQSASGADRDVLVADPRLAGLHAELSAVNDRVKAWQSEQWPTNDCCQHGGSSGVADNDACDAMMADRLLVMRATEQDRALRRSERLIAVIQARLDACQAEAVDHRARTEELI